MMLAIAQRVGFDGPLTDLECRPVWLAADGTQFHIAHGPAAELAMDVPADSDAPLEQASASTDLLVAVSSGAGTFAAMGLAQDMPA